jgi:hypothetical protein
LSSVLLSHSFPVGGCDRACTTNSVPTCVEPGNTGDLTLLG